MSKLASRSARRRSGQTMVFMVSILVIVLFLVIWNFDLHKILSVKFMSQNGGDAAALSAARWQAISLNLVGDLNIMQAVAIMDSFTGVGDPAAADTISSLQSRICFVGPMTGLMAAQQAAKKNGLHDNDEFTSFLKNHVSTIKGSYPKFISEPYQGCLAQYADMLEAVCNNGIAAGVDNMVLYDDNLGGGGHMLLNRSFYDAISTKNWCWFFLNAYDLLATYANYHDWPPLPGLTDTTPMNCEFFSLHLTKSSFKLQSSELISLMNSLKTDRDLPGVSLNEFIVKDTEATWFGYDGQWDRVFAMSESNFPAAGTVKPQHNYVGADAAIRTATTPDMRSPGGATHEITWTAAAKPFSQLEDDKRPNAYGIVLPSFNTVRLIPVDASSAPWGGSFDLAFREHVEKHLPLYLAFGTSKLVGACWYCQQLSSWEDPTFRGDGITWLVSNSDQCFSTGGGGGGGDGGGTRRGH